MPLNTQVHAYIITYVHTHVRTCVCTYALRTHVLRHTHTYRSKQICVNVPIYGPVHLTLHMYMHIMSMYVYGCGVWVRVCCINVCEHDLYLYKQACMDLRLSLHAHMNVFAHVPHAHASACE